MNYKNNSDALEYLNSNWLNCIPKWVKYERVDLPLNLQETNNPVEVINKQFKQFFARLHYGLELFNEYMVNDRHKITNAIKEIFLMNQ